MVVEDGQRGGGGEGGDGVTAHIDAELNKTVCVAVGRITEENTSQFSTN